tara:strand:- start:1081 stop:1953 length:873 start_codon:yes stop_codon:yes gene_type:complete
MKKKTNTDLIEKFLSHLKKDKEKNLSTQTLKTYENIGNSLPFNILTSQTTIIKKLKDLYDNPNTLALYLNMIILIRRFNDDETDKLIKMRNSLRDAIIKERKDNLTKFDDTLPTLKVINEELDNLTGIQYIINYLIVNLGLRNQDMNLRMVKSFDDVDDNQLKVKGKKVLLNINDYKTEKSFGKKELEINDSKFLNELKNMKLNQDDYLITMKNGDKIKNIVTWNDKLKKLTINQLGQNKLVKIVIRDLLNNKQYDKLEKLSKSRGTSLQVLLTSYNLHNGNKDEDEKKE